MVEIGGWGECGGWGVGYGEGREEGSRGGM